MFDSVPPNLPVEPGVTPQSSVVPPPAPPSPPLMVPSAPTPSGKREPEDIFSDLDRAPVITPPSQAIYDAPSRSSSSPVKIVLLVVLILVLVGGAGFGVWYFLIRSTEEVTPVAVTPSSVNAPVVPSIPEPIVEKPITPPPSTETPAVPMVPPNLPVPEPIANPTPTAPVQALMEGADTDGDGVSDVEEVAIGTNATVADSDADGFADGSELTNGYDPTVQKGTLAASPTFRATTLANAWSVLLPISWSVKLDAAVPGASLIQTGTPTAFEVRVADKPMEMSLTDWVAQTDPATALTNLIPFTTRVGNTALRSQDRLIVYITTGNSVVTIRYQAREATSYDARTLFEHVIQTIHHL